MKILYLPLKKEWYEMIERGEKLEEYRELTPHWIVRLLEWTYVPYSNTSPTERITMEEARIVESELLDAFGGHIVPKNYYAVCFSYGYTKRRMTFECKGITIGRGRTEWGAPDYETFIIKLGAEMI